MKMIKMKMQHLFFLVLSVCAISAWGIVIIGTTSPVTVYSSHPQFNITMASNASTGYRWVLTDDYDHDLVKAIKFKYYPRADGVEDHMVGHGGYAQFTFELTPDAFSEDHDIQLNFKYTRPWDSDVDDRGSNIREITRSFKIIAQRSIVKDD